NGTQISPSNQQTTAIGDSNVQNGTYTYSVRSWNVTGFFGPASIPVTVNIGPAGVPTGLQASVDQGGVHLSWQPAANAYTYGVYRNGTQISPASQAATTFVDPNGQI